MLDRLLDVLLVLAIRTDFRHSPAALRWYQAACELSMTTIARAVGCSSPYAVAVSHRPRFCGLRVNR